MILTWKKLERQISFGLSMCECVCMSVCHFFKKLLNVACHGFENSCKITDPYFLLQSYVPLNTKSCVQDSLYLKICL